MRGSKGHVERTVWIFVRLRIIGGSRRPPVISIGRYDKNESDEKRDTRIMQEAGIHLFLFPRFLSRQFNGRDYH